MQVRVRGGMPAEVPPWLEQAPADAPDATMLLIDDAHLLLASGEGDALAGVWTSHSLLIFLAQRALQAIV
jgi:hypothetical protein